MRICTSLILVTLVLCGSTSGAAERSATVVGSRIRVAYQRTESTLLLDAKSTAAAFGWQAKVVRPGKLLTLCRDEKGGACIPVRLVDGKFLTKNGELFVEAAVLARALGFSFEDRDNRVTLRRGLKIADSDIPAYHAVWGKGRGFRVGQTLPDIPLYDMSGREVRFSRFLGKQYIIYCWASW